MAAEDTIRNVINTDKSAIERLEKTYKEGGFMERQINRVQGDPSYLSGVREALDDLYRALEEAEYAALAHLDVTEQEDPAIADVRRLAGLK